MSPRAARCVDMISRRDHAQRPRGTRTKSAERDRPEGSSAAGISAHGASTAAHDSGRRSALPRRLALTHPPHDPYPPPIRKKHRQHRSEGAAAAGSQPGPHRYAHTWRDLVARVWCDQVLHSATLTGRSVHLREQTNEMSHRRASGSKHRSCFNCQAAMMHILWRQRPPLSAACPIVARCWRAIQRYSRPRTYQYDATPPDPALISVGLTVSTSF